MTGRRMDARRADGTHNGNECNTTRAGNGNMDYGLCGFIHRRVGCSWPRPPHLSSERSRQRSRPAAAAAVFHAYFCKLRERAAGHKAPIKTELHKRNPTSRARAVKGWLARLGGERGRRSGGAGVLTWRFRWNCATEITSKRRNQLLTKDRMLGIS